MNYICKTRIRNPAAELQFQYVLTLSKSIIMNYTIRYIIYWCSYKQNKQQITQIGKQSSLSFYVCTTSRVSISWPLISARTSKGLGQRNDYPGDLWPHKIHKSFEVLNEWFKRRLTFDWFALIPCYIYPQSRYSSRLFVNGSKLNFIHTCHRMNVRWPLGKCYAHIWDFGAQRQCQCSVASCDYFICPIPS